MHAKWGFINSRGAVVIEAQFDKVEPFSEGLAPACIGRCEYVQQADGDSVWFGKWGYVNTEGKFVIYPQFSEADVFSQGLAAVTISEKKLFTQSALSGYINHSGKFVIAPHFTIAYTFDTAGTAIVSIGSGEDERQGMIDTNGRFVVNPRFYLIEPFDNGLAGVQEVKDGGTGYIDRTGAYVWRPSK
jgi:hypothetical protein